MCKNIALFNYFSLRIDRDLTLPKTRSKALLLLFDPSKSQRRPTH